MRWMAWMGAVVVLLLGAPSGSAAQSDELEELGDAEARGLFEAGRAAFQAARYEDALDYFQRAYERSQRHRLLYNIGQAADRLRRDRDALTAFEAFLREEPEGSRMHAEVAERVRLLREVIAREQATPPTGPPPGGPGGPPPPGPPPEEPGGGAGIGPILLLAGGGALAVTGAVFMGLASSEASDVTDAPDGSRWADLQGTADSAETKWTIGQALLGVGVAAAVGGVIWLAVGSGGTETEVAIGPGSIHVRGAL